jgi:CRISPR system Cascade subunit CasB
VTENTLEPSSNIPAAVPLARARDWWARYCHPRDGDPGVRARLRRCHSATDALSIRPAIILARQCGAPSRLVPANEWKLVRGLNLARVLAHVTNDDRARFPMQAAGWKSFPSDRKAEAAAERPLLSELRFRRLIDADSGEEQVTAFVRLVHLLDGTVNIEELARAFLFWNDYTKKRWTFDYYAAGIAAPQALPTNDEDDDA